ncbi:acetylornithine deacetylase [Colletotrichum karsti]|uniref:Acetylornithine deacetylase n=1 Tax=Colletotrichum karsti TaxID=1095194 RepID=A0A9P6I0M0_9PEZI|nr:acetylornithine deacetylase [Colletotrichum karsti]KAF9871821.1 acetylornithine deacetylase [Colletotrichum karsti]
MTAVPASNDYSLLDAWVDAHFEEELTFLQSLVRVPTDTPLGDNAPHAEVTAELLHGFGFEAERHPVPEDKVLDYGMKSITNLIVRRHYNEGGRTVALNAHGDVVPPGEGWTRDPYGAVIEDGVMYGRATAVSKSDFASFTFAVRALEFLKAPLRGSVELHFTYDEEFGGELGPGWLLSQGLTKPDLLIAAGFSYEVVTAHNGCLQMEVTVNGKQAHAAIPDTGVDALQGAVTILNALYALNARYREVRSEVAGITHPYLNVGRIEGDTNTNVVPGKVVFKLDRRMIPEEDPKEVEAEVRRTIAEASEGLPGISVDLRRLLLANSMRSNPGNEPLVQAIQKHTAQTFGQPATATGTPLYTDVRLYAEAGIPGVIYGAGPRTVLESHAKRADERLQLDDLRRATKVIARTLQLYTGPGIPKGPDDYLYTDRPQLGLRVISFKNSTIVVLYWLHLSLDAIALGSLLKAWTLMLQGRESEILEPLSDYPLEDLGKNPTEPHLLVDQRLSTIGLARWLFWNLYNLAIRPRENRIVCIPAAYLKDLREKATKELATQAALKGITEAPSLSEGDVILAWLAQVGFSNLPKDSKQPVALQQAFEWRKTLSDLMPANRPTLGNCIGFTVTVILAKDLLQRPLSYVASQIRGALNVQRSREQIEAYTSFIREDPRSRAPPLFGDVSMKLLMFSNWQKATLYETDFSAAARSPTGTPLFPSYIQTVQGPYNFNDGLIMVGKDPKGNYWFGGYRAEGLWEMMNRKMREDDNEPQPKMDLGEK